MTSSMRTLQLSLVMCSFAASTSARAAPGPTEQSPSRAQVEREEARERALASEVIDPTASLLNVHLLYEWTLDHYDGEGAEPSEGDSHTFTLRPVIPFSAWGATNILRLSLPYELDSASSSDGLGATQILDLVVVEQSWGRWGAGAVVNLAPAGSAEGPFQLGPALGAVGTVGEWTLGVLNQNLLNEHAQLSLLQPILGYEILPSLSVSIGELEIVWDWEAGKLEALPVGVQLNLVVPLLKQPVRFSANPQLNLIDEAGVERWSVIFGFALLVPKE